VCFLTTMMLPLAAAAQSKLGPNGSPITTSNYSVDLTIGVARGNARIRAMGGAYVAVAEGVGANLVNPAGSAIRGPWSRMNFNYDFGLFMTFPGGAGSKDWFNSGTDGTDIGADRPFPFAFTFLTFTNNFR